MKKFISFVMAAVLCVGMTTTVFATESITTGTANGTEGTITSVKSDLDLEVKALAGGQYAAVEEEITAKHFAKDTAREILGYENVKSATTLGYFELNVKTGSETGNVTFNCSSISKGDNILVLHYDGTKWEKRPVVEVGNGYVTAKFDGFSPVALVEYTEHTAYVYDDTTVEETTSPKTADVAMFGLYAAVALAGTVTAARKAKASK